MKHGFLLAVLFLCTSLATISKTPLQIEGINIDMNEDILYASTDGPNDSMRQIKVFNGGGQQVAYKKCSGGPECSLDLHNLPSGIYVATAWSLQGQLSESIYVN